MPYDILEKKIKSLPPVYFKELLDYLEFLLDKSEKENSSVLSEEESLRKISETGISTAWEYLKDDTW